MGKTVRTYLYRIGPYLKMRQSTYRNEIVLQVYLKVVTLTVLEKFDLWFRGAKSQDDVRIFVSFIK